MLISDLKALCVLAASDREVSRVGPRVACTAKLRCKLFLAYFLLALVKIVDINGISFPATLQNLILRKISPLMIGKMRVSEHE